MLLGMDGTVTHILEAYADQPIDVVKLLQEIDTWKPGDARLLLSEGKVLRRHVLLRARRSRQTLLYAEAVVALERADPTLLQALLETDKPIGVILAENRTETFREILELGREPAGSCGDHFGIGPAAELIFRTYRILAGQQPVILITEKFPADSFRELPA